MAPSDALQALIKQFLIPLHEKIMLNSKMKNGHEGGIIDIKFDELVALVYRDVGGVLLEVYKMYFPNEVKGGQGSMLEETMWKYNEKNYFEFMKDFDICPSLLSKSVAF